MFNAFPRALIQDSIKESSFQPNLVSDLNNDKRPLYRTYVPVNDYDSSVFLNRKFKEYSWLRRKLLYENFIIIDTGKLHITIDPLLNVSRGNAELKTLFPDVTKDRDVSKTTYTNTRGVLIRADIGSKFSLETYFYENQARLPYYVTDFVRVSGIVPGQGRIKEFKGDSVTFDYAMSGGYFSFRPTNNLNIQFGHHKHFIGDGHRSLVLSDNSFNYPFLKFELSDRSKKWRYSVLYTLFQDLDRVGSSTVSEDVFRRHGGTYHVLEFAPNKKLRLSLIQGVKWPNESIDKVADIDPAMLNPIILVHPISSGLDSKNNALLALGWNLKATKEIEVYSQFVMDDLDKSAAQLGAKFWILPTLFLQTEGNWIMSQTYGPTSESAYNAFVHYNQALAHPMINDLREVIVKLAYRYKRFIPFFQMNYSEAENWTLEPILWTKTELAYLLNPATNLKIFASCMYRSEGRGSDVYLRTDTFFNFGIKTDLRNIYYDF